jgi:hypothetical protein
MVVVVLLLLLLLLLLTFHHAPGDIVLGVWQSRDDWQPVVDTLEVTEVAMEHVRLVPAVLQRGFLQP